MWSSLKNISASAFVELAITNLNNVIAGLFDLEEGQSLSVMSVIDIVALSFLSSSQHSVSLKKQ